MSRQKILLVVGSLAFAALLLLPLYKVMRPVNREHGTLPPIDISALTPGHYLYTENNAQNGGFAAVLLVRDVDGHLYVYGLGKAKGRVMLPGKTWDSSLSGYCNEFRPDGANGVLAPNAIIACQDKDFYGKKFDAWRWTLQGKSLAPEATADLYQPKYTIIGQTVVVQQR